jgi:hypothetical protein
MTRTQDPGALSCCVTRGDDTPNLPVSAAASASASSFEGSCTMRTSYARRPCTRFGSSSAA